MLKLVAYKERWIFKQNIAVRVRVPIYKDTGKGGGIERSFRIIRDEHDTPIKAKPTSVKYGEI